MTRPAIQSLTFPPSAYDFAATQQAMRDHIISSLAVPLQALAGAADTCYSSSLSAMYAFGRSLMAVSERLLKTVAYGLVPRIMMAQLPRQLRRQIDALLRLGSGRTARLRKKRRDAILKARRLFWGHLGLPPLRVTRPCTRPTIT